MHGGSRSGDFALLIGATFCFYAFNNAETSAMPAYLMGMGAPALLASAQTSLFVLAAVLLRLYFGPLSDRRGPRFAMVVGALGFTLPCAVLPLCGEVWQVVALRACQAVGLAAFHPSVSLAVSRMVGPERLGARMGLVRFASTLSLMVGPALLFSLMDAAGPRAFFAALLALGCVGLAMLVPMRAGEGAAAPASEGRGTAEPDDAPAFEGAPLSSRVVDGSRVATQVAPTPEGAAAPKVPSREAASTDEPAPTVRELLARHAPLLMFPLVCAFGYGAVLNFGKLLAAAVAPDANSGLVFTFVSVGGLGGSLVCGALSDRFGARRVVAVCLGLVSCGALAMGIAQGFAGLAAGSVLFGLGYFGATTALTAELAREAGQASKGRALALQQSCLDVGLAAGGLCAGAFVQLTGSVTVAFLVTAALLAVSVAAWLVAACPLPHSSSAGMHRGSSR